MKRLKEMDNILNNTFKFILKEQKKYIFTESDIDGFTYINVTDDKAYNMILEDKQRFAQMIKNYVNISEVKLRKFNSTIKEWDEIEPLERVVIKEKIRNKIIKQKVFIVKKINVEDSVKDSVKQLRKEMYAIHDKAKADYNQYGHGKREEIEGSIYYGAVGALAKLHPFVERIEKLIK